MTRRLMIAGLTSGVGKTTVTCALLAAFRRRGCVVQPFKVGPDYIDPTHHALAAGRASRTLDTVMLAEQVVVAGFVRAAEQADFCLIEGVMGLFDGRGADGASSSAAIAKLLRTPVVVVLDVSHTAQTAGALALGCVAFDPELEVAGVILNRVASPNHAQIAQAAVERASERPVFGALPRDPRHTLAERYLGLVPTAETAADPGVMEALADAAEAHLDLEAIWAACSEAEVAGTPPLPSPPPLGGRGQVSLATLGGRGQAPSSPAGGTVGGRGRGEVVIAIARDRAFHFYYPDSLELLEAAGARLAPFSPMEDEALPPGAQGVYLGGGFPELFAAELSANRPMHEALRRAAERGLPIYGECGGLMYLAQSISDRNGRRWPMAGLIPGDSHMRAERVTVGYRTVTTRADSPILSAGSTVIGHEFHYSQLEAAPAGASAAYEIAERDGATEGYIRGNVLASYVHLHFGSEPSMAARFVAACAASRSI